MPPCIFHSHLLADDIHAWLGLFLCRSFQHPGSPLKHSSLQLWEPLIAIDNDATHRVATNIDHFLAAAVRKNFAFSPTEPHGRQINLHTRSNGCNPHVPGIHHQIGQSIFRHGQTF